MLERLAEAVNRHHVGIWGETAVPRQTLVALDESIAPSDQQYVPMICFTVAGAKRSVSGERSWVTRGGEMFLNSLATPVSAIFERVPYRSVVLHLDSKVLAGSILEMGETAIPGGEVLTTAPMTPEIVDAVTRWVCLLDAPQDIGVLAGRVEGEILYRLLAGPLGPALRQWSRTDTAAARIREAATWIVDHYDETLAIDGIAAIAHMSPATLHRHFKAATGMSPMRFQKQLRLQEARRRMMAGEGSAAEVAQSVGYASATQFNREYRRFYGLPPGQDTKRLQVKS
ncbi:AraC family transcriptional regulator N-terminal domain-containing protein [Winogradskya consettensis]|uniref:AraC family transcriptional regulator n=1 Tax=Winogradskya consettensis TaxID=113560 RepID=A0A919S8N6_9ACTN|nr:AraC family transcriptional regulator [Actinoplanes consettensis]GIM66933.1 AraC family transcriptional regulator [Actinoplanes consettensis]